MIFSDEQIGEGQIDEVISKDEFDPDQLDIEELVGDDESEKFIHTPRKNPYIFLARLQWWAFGFLVAFILFIILRMIIGPPWLDRFLYPRPPVAIDSSDGLIGVIVPVQSGDFRLFLVDSNGGIRGDRDLGRIVPGPVDLAMSPDHYYFMYGEGSWIAGRPYVQPPPVPYYTREDDGDYSSEEPSMLTDQSGWIDVDLNQFNLKYRDGIDLLESADPNESLCVFSEDAILVLQNENNLWRKVSQFDPKTWKESYWSVNELAGNFAIVSSGSGFELLDFTGKSGDYSDYSESTYLKLLKTRPHFPGEYIYSLYKAADIILPAREDQKFDFILLRNDRMFNLPYKMDDDQVFEVYMDRNEFAKFNHPFFARKDIRALEIVDDKPESDGAQMVVLYELDSQFHLAGLKMDKAKPLWDLILGQVATIKK